MPGSLGGQSLKSIARQRAKYSVVNRQARVLTCGSVDYDAYDNQTFHFILIII